jgi:hypothetical protein
MNRCSATKKDGTQCSVTVTPPDEMCWWHADETKHKRSRAAKRAVRGRPITREVKALKEQLKTLYDETLAENVSPNIAAELVQIQNCRLKAIETERRLKELGELEERISQLEAERSGNVWTGAG